MKAFVSILIALVCAELVRWEHPWNFPFLGSDSIGNIMVTEIPYRAVSNHRPISMRLYFIESSGAEVNVGYETLLLLLCIGIKTKLQSHCFPELIGTEICKLIRLAAAPDAYSGDSIFFLSSKPVFFFLLLIWMHWDTCFSSVRCPYGYTVDFVSNVQKRKNFRHKPVVNVIGVKCPLFYL